MGIHTKYTPELAAVILERLADGRSLLAICRMADIPVSEAAVRRWAAADIDGFSSKYARARDLGLYSMADEILEIAGTLEIGTIEEVGPNGRKTTTRDMVEHRRLKVDSRKWYLSKLAPKRYGDRLRFEHGRAPAARDTTLDDAQRVVKIAALFSAVHIRREPQVSVCGLSDLM